MSSFFYHAKIETDGTIKGDTSLTLDSTTITTAEIGVLHSVTAGTAAASKALVLGGSSNITGLGTVGCGAITSSGNLAVTGTITGDTSLTLDSTTITTAEIGVLDGVTAGTAAANKALVLGGSGNVTGLGTVGCGLITTSGTPTENDHVATKQYVDDVASGLDVKKSVRVATTANGTLASAFANEATVDGVTLATNDRILIKNQSTGSENGIYTVNGTGAPTRATDFDTNAEVTAGAFTFVEEGGQEDTGWVLTTNDAITVGTTALAFSQFSGGGTITAGTGLTKTGNTLSVNAAQTQITSVGTLTALTVDDVAIDGKVITMTGDTDDTAVFTVGTNGTLSIVTTDTAAAAANIEITADGTVDINSAGALTLDSGAAINLEPAAGSAILLDGTISIDAGVVTGATSITSTAFVGALTGNVTGNCSGTAATVTTAAQSNITSLGTLTALTVDDVAIDGKVITMTGDTDDTAVFTVGTNGTLSIVTTDTAAAAANIEITADGTVDINSAGALTLDSGAAINLEPAAGSAILLDGTISIDAGVVTGATSITSTAFVGALTGNVTGNCSGTAATVTTAAQSNITSLGTLTALTVGGQLTLGIQQITIESDVTSKTSGSPDSVTISKSNIVIKGSSDNNYYAQFANPTVGTIINIFYCSSSSDGSISFDFGTSKLYNGSGLSQSLKFDSPGQAATLVYIGDQSGNSTSNIWAIINTGAVVS